MSSGKITGLDAPTNPSDAANKAYVDNHTNASCALVGNDIICSGIPDNTAGTLSITKNGVTCPIWKDCDGDGYTYGNGDCDESCPTCYAGNTAVYPSMDGKDNDCDGTVDDIDCSPEVAFGFNSNCEWVKEGEYKYSWDSGHPEHDCPCRRIIVGLGDILQANNYLRCHNNYKWGKTFSYDWEGINIWYYMCGEERGYQ